jgi:hypothetical protein
MFYHSHFYSPALIFIGGKNYIIPGWKEVPIDTKLTDIIWEKENIEIKELKTITKTFVSSSDSSILYKTQKIEQPDGKFKYHCNCPGYWRSKDKKCKHIKELEKC